MRATLRLFLSLILVVPGSAGVALAQSTAFGYQGQLLNHGSPANGVFDLGFALFTTPTGGTAAAGPITNTDVTVSNGLFAVTLDFGAVFTGQSYWLETAVATNGAPLATLAPRQALQATPYALYAPSAGLAITAASAQTLAPGSAVPLTALPNSVLTNGARGVNLSGVFAGDGSALTNVPAQPLTLTVESIAAETNGVQGAVANGTEIYLTNYFSSPLHTNLAGTTPMQMTNVEWGDSLTYGYSIGPFSIPYTYYLQQITGIPSINLGISGAGSTLILSNFMSHPELWGMNTIIWSGANDHNSPQTVLSNVAVMVSHLTTTNWLVLSLIMNTNQGIGTVDYSNEVYVINPGFQAAYSNHYVDVHEYLVRQADFRLPGDYFTFTNDTPAAHLHFDNSVHLTPVGYAGVADAILQSGFLGLSSSYPSLGTTLALINQQMQSPAAVGAQTPGLGIFYPLRIGPNATAELSISGDSSLVISGVPNIEPQGGAAAGLGEYFDPFNSLNVSNWIQLENGAATTTWTERADGALNQQNPVGEIIETPALTFTNGHTSLKGGDTNNTLGFFGNGGGLTNVLFPATNSFGYVLTPPPVTNRWYYTNNFGRRVTWMFDVTNAATGYSAAYTFSPSGSPLNSFASVSLPSAPGYHGSMALNLAPGEYFAITNVAGGPLQVCTNSIQEW